MISPFVSAGFKGRPECGMLVSLNYLCYRLDHIYSTKYSEFLFFDKNTNTVTKVKGEPFSFIIFVISFYVDYNQKQVYRKLSGLVLGGLCAYVSIPPW